MLFIYYVHKEKGSGDHKILGNFADDYKWCFLFVCLFVFFEGGRIFDTLHVHKSKTQANLFLVIINSFLHYFLLLTVTLFFETYSVVTLICSSIIERTVTFMKVRSGNMCLLFCQFYYRLINTVRFNEEKTIV